MKRIQSLDSLRGIAALIVVFNHFFFLFQMPQIHHSIIADAALWQHWQTWIALSPLNIFVNGYGAVIVFFVLSGFVLTHYFTKNSDLSYVQYAVRRFCRIYMPFAVSIFFAAFLFHVSRPVNIPSLSEWFNTMSWNDTLTSRSVGLHLLMTGRLADADLNNVMWSLVHELRISFLFPLIFLLVARSFKWSVIVTIFLYAVPAIILSYIPIPKDSMIRGLLGTIHYAAFFVWGCAIAVYQEKIREKMSQFSQMEIIWFGLSPSMALFMIADQFKDLADCAYGVSACIWVILALTHLPTSRFLQWKPFLWLGRVSYSLYLMHLPILLAMVHVFYGAMPLLCLLGLSFALILMTAEIAYNFVERPSIALGKYLSRPQALS